MIQKALKFILLCAASLLFLLSFGLGFIYLQNLFAYNTIATYETWASLGLADAKYRLALSYIRGGVLKKDIPKALELLTEASDQNHTNALIQLGVLYHKGIEVEKDEKKALHYFEKAASLNNSMGVFNLGIMYQLGYGTDQDFEKAYSLYEQSENMGYSDASVKLGEMNYKGIGRKADINKAFSHFLKGAEKGNPTAQYWVGWYYEVGDGDIEIDYKAAFEWYKKSADQNSPDGLYMLGNLYFWGHGVDQDYLKSGEYYTRAAAIGDTKAIDFLNSQKEFCQTETKNRRVKNALISCFIAASTRDPASMHAVGFAYHAGLMNLKRSYENAFSWFLPCAEYGYAPCQVSVASFYKNGLGVEKNPIEAYAWFSAAVNSKDLGDMERRLSEVMIKIIYKDLTADEKIKAEKKAREYEQLYSKLPQ